MTNDKKKNLVDVNIHHDTSDKDAEKEFGILKKHMTDNNSKTLLFADIVLPFISIMQILNIFMFNMSKLYIETKK